MCILILLRRMKYSYDIRFLTTVSTASALDIPSKRFQYSIYSITTGNHIYIYILHDHSMFLIHPRKKKNSSAQNKFGH